MFQSKRFVIIIMMTVVIFSFNIEYVITDIVCTDDSKLLQDLVSNLTARQPRRAPITLYI